MRVRARARPFVHYNNIIYALLDRKKACNDYYCRRGRIRTYI